MTLVETVVARPALGLRFSDPLTGAAVTDGLDVTLRTGDRRVVPVVAPRTARGAFGAHAGIGAATATVRDTSGRYLPFTVPATLPAGLLLDPCDPASAAPPAGGIALLSAPQRPVPPAMAAVRATAWDVEGDRPAAWARIDLEVAGRTFVGAADHHGALLVVLPWPAPPPASGGAGTPALGASRWDVRIRARWSTAMASLDGPPDLCALRAQPVVRVRDRVGSNAPLVDRELVYGRELVLRTTDSSSLLLDPTP